MAAITQAQSRVLEFIASFIEKHRYSPSFQEIADALGLRSLATVHKHVESLKAKGVLGSSVNRSRSVEILERDPAKVRFEFHSKDHLWDTIEGCYWVREKR